jgi:hypothetical protein
VSHSRRTIPSPGSGPATEDKLFARLSDCIGTEMTDPDTALIALLPLTCHAAVQGGMTKEEFLETAGMAFGAMEKRFKGDI